MAAALVPIPRRSARRRAQPRQHAFAGGVMDGATLQAKIYRGYAVAAQKAGLAFSQFRPTGAANPLAGAPLATLEALFTPARYGEFGTRHTGDHDTALWHALIDGTQTQIGDYLVGASTTYFVAAQQPLLPIL